MELIENPEWLVGHSLGYPLSIFYQVVHRTEPGFVMDVQPGSLTAYHRYLSNLWEKGGVTWWGKKPWLLAAHKLTNSAFEEFERYFQIWNQVVISRNSPVSLDGYYSSCIGRIGGLGGVGYGTDWFIGRPPQALTFYADNPSVFDDWVVHLAQPVFAARVRGAAEVVSATSPTDGRVVISSSIESEVLRALRSYYYLFFASLDELYARYKKPFARACLASPSLEPESADLNTDYEFDEDFRLTLDEGQTRQVFRINITDAEVYRGNILLTPPTDMLDFNVSDAALRSLWREEWFASETAPANDLISWVPFPRDNPYINTASTLLAEFLKNAPLNAGNVLARRLCVPLARDLALTLPAKKASITGERLLQWVNSKLKLPPDAPVSLFDESTLRATCATA